MIFEHLEQPYEEAVKKLETWLNELIALIPNILVSLLLLICTFIFAHLFQKITLRLLKKASKNPVLNGLFSSIVYYIILALGFIIALEVLNLGKAVTSLLAGLGILGLALGFAFKEIVANFVSGIILALRTPFTAGDIVEVNGIYGKVIRTSLRVTVIDSFHGQDIYIPNSDVLNNPIYNYTINGKRRLDMEMRVSLAEDLYEVERVVRETIKNMEGVIDHDNTIFDFYEFGDSSAKFYIRFWIDFPGQVGFFQGRNRAVQEIKRAFDKNGIQIPFPVRSIDFGVKGGQKLEDIPFNYNTTPASNRNKDGKNSRADSNSGNQASEDGEE